MSIRNMALVGLVVFLLIALILIIQGPSGGQQVTEITYSRFLSMVDNGEISTAKIRGERISGNSSNGRYTTWQPAFNPGFPERLIAAGAEVNVEPVSRGPTLISALINAIPLLLIIGIWIFLMRQMQGSGGRAMSFGRSRARLLTEKQGRVTFDDVAGVDEAKEELQEIVEFLQDQDKFQRLGGKIPKGALLVGPPGTGKTLIARAVAGEANVPFFTISGSDFVEMFVGVGASRVRDMFEQAKKNAPCIIFIDEIDAVGRSRGAGLGGGNDEREQTLNQLLVEMDGFEANEGVILIAATNRPDVLDPALLRPGRFDRQVVVGNPDILGREKILKVHMRQVPLDKNVKTRTIARGTPGFSGADLANLVNEAALLAARRGRTKVSMLEFEDAKDKVLMGPERRSMVMSVKEKELTAWHEAGHAIVALNVPCTDPVHKATIIPRGRALGVVMQIPEADKLSQSRVEMTSRLAILMGGRIAEELHFGEENVTAGAASDIQQATRLARAMVTRWGMSENVGPVDYAEDQGEVFLGQQIVRSSHVSEHTSQQIEQEIRNLVQTGMETAKQILQQKAKDWQILAEGLLEYETLSGEEINDLLNGKSPERPDEDEGPESAVPVIVPTARPRSGDYGAGAPEPQGA